jgi:hypothetical protein
MAKLIRTTTQPAIKTGVMRGVRVLVIDVSFGINLSALLPETSNK